MVKGAGDVECRDAGRHGTLDAGACALLAEAAGQSPAAGRDVRDLGDGLHLLRASDADLRNPESAADVHPLGPASSGLQGSSALVADQARRLDT